MSKVILSRCNLRVPNHILCYMMNWNKIITFLLLLIMFTLIMEAERRVRSKLGSFAERLMDYDMDKFDDIPIRQSITHLASDRTKPYD